MERGRGRYRGKKEPGEEREMLMSVWQVQGVILKLEKNNGVHVRKKKHRLAFLNLDLNESSN